MRLKPGLYKLTWIDGGYSLAAVGCLHDGSNWYAPVNWTSKCEHGVASTKWEAVDSIEAIHA